MQAIILAAGMGNRLGKFTKEDTKCMLDINGKKLIERALDALDVNGITKCIMVVGYKFKNLETYLGNTYKNIQIEYIVNDIYNKTNNIYSLYLAKERLAEDDTILLESDLIFEDRVITDLLKNPEPTLAVVAKYESWMDGTVVRINKDNVITQFIPKSFFDYKEIDKYFKTVNIYKLSKYFSVNSYIPFLEAYSKTMGNNEYYESVLRIITNLEKNEMKALCLTNHKWYEIDDVQDKDIAEAIFGISDDDKVAKIQKRFGGYWRFPYLLDFCYLVNPYFPTKTMLKEMKNSFKVLISEYPSGLNVQNLLAGKLFGVDDTCILTGNGAAELIRALSRVVDGSLGVIYPSFNEYPESFEKNSIVPLIPQNIGYTIKDLLSWCESCDNLLLINPDNPSGNFIQRKDLIVLLDKMKKIDKRLILDESFIDFADDGFENSLFDQSVLASYPNLVVIKSISKSYGVPGVRLGVLASGNAELIQKVRKHISIWNINSFGEFFLQIIGKYRKEYATACSKIKVERERFRTELESTGMLEVHPSQANYFLCKCTGKYTAGELVRHLLGSYDIFIKDLTGKQGIAGDRWVRIAVRNKKDNNILVEKLRALK